MRRIRRWADETFELGFSALVVGVLFVVGLILEALI